MAQDEGRPPSRSGTERRADALDAPIAAFDFDGTLTVRDSFTAFLKWQAGKARYTLGMAKLAPAALCYLIDRDRGRIKAAAAREFLRGLTRARLAALAEQFAERYAASLFRPDALAVWNDWGVKGARRVIVTASPALVVAPFARRLGADELIGTELGFDGEDRITGAFTTANCRGQEKVARLEARYGPGLRLAAAYGDTTGDREMLAIAEVAGYRAFTGRPRS